MSLLAPELIKDLEVVLHKHGLNKCLVLAGNDGSVAHYSREENFIWCVGALETVSALLKARAISAMKVTKNEEAQVLPQSPLGQS